MDALEFLRREHENIKQLFADWETASVARKSEILARLRGELQSHTQAERELFYPALQEAIPELVKHALDDHARLDRMLDGLSAENIDAKMAELRTEIMEHISEEETDFFITAQRLLGAERLEELGREMEASKSRAAA